jgi:hypothetical protein
VPQGGRRKARSAARRIGGRVDVKHPSSRKLDHLKDIQYVGLMIPQSIGRPVAARRRALRLRQAELAARAAKMRTHVPGAAPVGGAAAAVHVTRRAALDHDHVVRDRARSCYAPIRARESIVGRRTRRKPAPGEVDHLAAGRRKWRRCAPPATLEVGVRGGGVLRLPSVGVMPRSKARLLMARNATRDNLNGAALGHRHGATRRALALAAQCADPAAAVPMR